MTVYYSASVTRRLFHDQDLEDFLVLRELDQPITDEDLDAAGEQSGEASEELRDEGVGIRWVDSEVMKAEDGKVAGTLCHYQAEDEQAVREHADRADLPAELTGVANHVTVNNGHPSIYF